MQITILRVVSYFRNCPSSQPGRDSRPLASGLSFSHVRTHTHARTLEHARIQSLALSVCLSLSIRGGLRPGCFPSLLAPVQGRHEQDVVTALDLVRLLAL